MSFLFVLSSWMIYAVSYLLDLLVVLGSRDRTLTGWEWKIRRGLEPRRSERPASVGAASGNLPVLPFLGRQPSRQLAAEMHRNPTSHDASTCLTNPYNLAPCRIYQSGSKNCRALAEDRGLGWFGHSRWDQVLWYSIWAKTLQVSGGACTQPGLAKKCLDQGSPFGSSIANVPHCQNQKAPGVQPWTQIFMAKLIDFSTILGRASQLFNPR